jgi:hypothetical protein
MNKALGCRFGYPGNRANPEGATLSRLRLILDNAVTQRSLSATLQLEA